MYQQHGVGGGSGTRVAEPPLPAQTLASHWFLLLGAAAMAIPTLLAVARQSWSTEQGAHGPIVLATGIWLVGLHRKQLAAVMRPGHLGLTLLLLVPALLLYAIARVTTTLELEGLALYLSLVILFYGTCGPAAMRLLWFPILYFLFVFPPPDSLVAVLTQPLKLRISAAAVDLLYAFGLPIGHRGVMIQIDQYDILVAAACAGLNSIISLSAIGSFYIYVRHNANWRYALLLMLAILPVAILANFVRVLLLILITYYAGDVYAQGFLHGFAGIVMFTVALLGIFAIDRLARPLRQRLSTSVHGQRER
jgi:exosortase